MVDAAEAERMGYKLVIWPCFALTSAYLAYQQAARELQSTGALKDVVNDQGQTGGVREVFELCGLSECAEFDRQMGGQSYRDGI